MNNSEFKQDVERKIIKYLLKNKLFLALGDGSLNSKFFSDEYKNVYKLLISYYRQNNDVLSLNTAEMLFQNNQYKHLTADDLNIFRSIYNDDLIDIDLNEASFSSTISVLKNQYKKDQLLSIAEQIIDANNQTLSAQEIDDLNNSIINQTTSLANNDSLIRKVSSIAESADEQLEAYNFLRDNPNSIEYVPTGFNAIDNAEGGFRPSELVYIIGRKGTGKSILLLNLAYTACKAGNNVLLFSLEISKEDYERRLAACACSIPSNGLKRATLSEADYNRYVQYLQNLKEHKSVDGKNLGELVIVDVPNQCTPSFVESRFLLEQRKRNLKFKVVVVDYAGLMQPDIFVPEKRHQQGAIALSFKRFARKYEILVCSAAQMSRQGRNDISQKGGHADSAHIAESDQVADHIDWGLAIRLNDPDSKYGILESFKTRDAAPFAIPFYKNYAMMQMLPAKTNEDGTPGDPEGLNWSNDLI